MTPRDTEHQNIVSQTMFDSPNRQGVEVASHFEVPAALRNTEAGTTVVQVVGSWRGSVVTVHV